jgi:hypothetical protein
MDGLTPPNSPKYCKSCIFFAGLKAMILNLKFYQISIFTELKTTTLFIFNK